MDPRALEDAIRRHIRFSLCQRIEEFDSSDRTVAEYARDIWDVRPV